MRTFSGIRRFFSLLPAHIGDGLFPRKCPSCLDFFSLKPENNPAAALGNKAASQRLVADPKIFQILAGAFLCPPCASRFQPAISPMCPRCGEVFFSRKGVDHLCKICAGADPPLFFNAARSAGIWDNGLKSAVLALKYHRRTGLAPALGRMLFYALCTHFPHGFFDGVIAVPLHPIRLRRREFNQSRLLIAGWPKMAEKQGIALPSMDLEVLIRRRDTQSQSGMDAAARRKNIQDAFAVRPGAEIKGRRFLVVDDVYTTGATVNACAKVLIQAGAASVDILTLARTQKRF